MARYTLFTRYYVASSCPISEVLKSSSRDSSVGRASDWRSEGPWFNPGSRHFWTTVQKRYSASKPHLEPARWGKPLLAFWRLWVAFSPMRWKWRIRVSIPVPLECKSSALPLELIPLASRMFRKPPGCMNVMRTGIYQIFVLFAPIRTQFCI